jgi:hypothetical protein
MWKIEEGRRKFGKRYRGFDPEEQHETECEESIFEC